MIRERLRFLYGQEAGDRAVSELERLLGRYRGRLPAPGPVAAADRFDERDSILITYGDTLNRPGLPPLRTLSSFAERHLQGRLSTIHVLPFFPYSSDYGFSVIDYERVEPGLGSWEDIAELRSRFRLMFDLVLNHVSAEHEWFRRFLHGEPPYDRFFITLDPSTNLSAVTRPRTTPLLTPFDTANGRRWVWTTFSPDQVDLDYGNPEVLLRMVEVILSYVEQGAGLLRLDAVGYLWKEVGTPSIHLPQTHEVVRLFRDVLDLVAPQVAIVTETNVPHRDNVSYFAAGSDEAQMVYQFSLAPLVLDAFSRADAGRLAAWAADLSTPSPATTFLNFLASHDGIGVVPARGLISTDDVATLVRGVRSRGGEVSCKTDPDGGESPYELNSTFFDALSGPPGGPESWRTRLDRFACAHAICLALAGVPGIYVHSLFGSHNDREAYARSGWKRDLNHGRLDLDVLESALADASSETARVFGRIAALLEARRSSPAFHPASGQRVWAPSPPLLAVARGPRRGETVLTLHNLSAARQSIGLGLLDAELAGGEADDLLSGRRFGPHAPLSALQPYEALWLRTRPGGERGQLGSDSL